MADSRKTGPDEQISPESANNRDLPFAARETLEGTAFGDNEKTVVDEGSAGAQQQGPSPTEAPTTPTVTTPLDWKSLEGKVIANCTIVRMLGKGGMGAVFLGHHETLDMPVAIKFLPPSFAQASDSASTRFLREARAAVKLQHSNIVSVSNAGQEHGLSYIIMEYVEGKSLQAILEERGTIPESEAILLLQPVLDALAYAHRNKLIHRDIKPDNIMIDNQGTVKVADLGLAKELGDRSSLTVTSAALGTPHYMAPEQAHDASKVDCRADLYSVGCTAYRMITGHVPFDGESVYQVLHKHQSEPTPDPSDHCETVSQGFAAIVRKLMEKDPEERYQTAEEVMADIQSGGMSAISLSPPKVSRAALSGGDRSPGEAGRRRSLTRYLVIASCILGLALLLFAYKDMTKLQQMSDGAAVTPGLSTQSGSGHPPGPLAAVSSGTSPSASSSVASKTPKTPGEWYERARMSEMAADFAAARRCYSQYFTFQQEFVDPYMDYSEMLRVQDGLIGTREIFKALLKRNHTRAAEFVSLSLLPGADARIQKLRAFLERHSDFAPAAYRLSQEFSVDALGQQAISDKLLERKYLRAFKALDEAGKAARFYLDKKRLQPLRKDVEARLLALEASALLLDNPVRVQGMESNAGLSLIFTIMEPTTEIFYKIGNADWRSTGLTGNVDLQTGKPRPNTVVSLPRTTHPVTMQVQYRNNRGQAMGPFPLTYDPQAGALAQTKQILKMTETSWVHWRQFNGKLMLYWTHLLGHRQKIKEIRYSFNHDQLDQTLPLHKEKENVGEIGAGLYMTLPAATSSVFVQVTFNDGSKTAVIESKKP